MATYNGARYLQAQLDSFISQTRQPDELIITDDCSIDETEAIVNEFAKTSPFTVEFYRNKKNLGYCGNFNAALMKTTGNLVFLCDQDDVWFPEKIEHMVDIAESNPRALVVMNDAALTDGELNEVGLTKIGQIRNAGLPLDRFVMGCCCAIRRELLDFCLPIPEGFRAHDSWLVKIADGLDAKLVDEKVLQYYRRHESNESQFIANRTTRVSRTSAFLHSSKKIFDPDTPLIEQRDIRQAKIFEAGIKNIGIDAPYAYQPGLDKLLEVTKNRTAWMERRFEMRRMSMVPRYISVIRYFIDGGYGTTGGLKAFFRDLAG
ncbi:glycosyltransferase family 2 protein [Marinobacter sp. ATCH36]|nr:glycosyltransferase family 2 protein [Marinobacter sp. ATCH36]